MRFQALLLAIALSGCATADPEAWPFKTDAIATFDQPWAMSFLPDGRMLVSEKAGRLYVVTTDGRKSAPIEGVPAVDEGGQGGFGDVLPDPRFADNGLIYLSYVEAGPDGTRGAVVARARLSQSGDQGSLSDLTVIWRQAPKVSGRGHFGHRLAFSPDGYLFISSGERQKFDPAQDMDANLGKIVRLKDDGSIPVDNPFADRGGIGAQVWTLGHRNPLGIAFDASGRLWEVEMGPSGGDELNLVERGGNYGYPIVSNGDHYSGQDIPDHPTHPEFVPPKVWWSPVISPSSLMIYRGSLFGSWRGSALIGGLSSESVVRVAIDGDSAVEAERFAMGRRIRAVREGPDGAIWLLEDGRGGRLLRLTPK